MARLGGGGDLVMVLFSVIDRASLFALDDDECVSIPTCSNFERNDARAAATSTSLVDVSSTPSVCRDCISGDELRFIFFDTMDDGTSSDECSL
mmetsp:Transcript_6950/g.18858  ORF Transcript_6950/g.18858 Transcript_6950/m.18858 type:complete len:93 (+) Transcript_6950:782-1060(+)